MVKKNWKKYIIEQSRILKLNKNNVCLIIRGCSERFTHFFLIEPAAGTCQVNVIEQLPNNISSGSGCVFRLPNNITDYLPRPVCAVALVAALSSPGAAP